MSRRADSFDWIVFACLAAVSIGLAVRAGNADFTYPDASRHAMDGVFLLDAAAERPFAALLEWAQRYYLTSPALGIGRYPPLLAALEAPFYAALGVCPLAARIVVALIWLAGLVFFYETLRGAIGRGAALFAAAALAVGPAAVRWGGEVMLELPATAFLLAAAFFYDRYRREGGRTLLTVSLMLVSLAGWVKQPAVLLMAPLFLYVLMQKRSLRPALRALWPGLAISLVLLAPLGLLSLKFGSANVMLLGGAGRHYPLFSTGNWLYYITQIPLYYSGWTLTAFVAVGAACAALRKASGRWVFWALWAGMFYIFFSAVGYKSARLCMFWTPALAYFAGEGFAWLSASARGKARAMVAAAGAVSVVGTLALSAARLEPTRTEIWEAARRALALVPQRILYCGPRNGTFIFRVRELAGRGRPIVVRASKVLYVNTIQEELGQEARPWTLAEIREKVAAIAPDVAVMEHPGGGQPAAAAVIDTLQDYLATGDFQLVDSVYAGAPPRPALDIYLYLGPRKPGAIDVDMPGVGMKLELPPGER